MIVKIRTTFLVSWLIIFIIKNMNIVILSRNKNLYSTKRLVEEAENRGHDVEVVDPLNCDLIIEKEKPTIYYK